VVQGLLSHDLPRKKGKQWTLRDRRGKERERNLTLERNKKGVFFRKEREGVSSI